MQTISINSQIVQNTSNAAYLDILVPNEVLAIIFDQIINQNQSSRDISSILLTCYKWKGILEKNPCIALVQNLFQLQNSPQFVIKHRSDCGITDQQNHFTSQELKLIDRVAYLGFNQLLMLRSKLFQPNSLLLSLLDRYSWDPEICQHSFNKNIRQLAKKQLSILNSLTSGTDDQLLNIIKKEKLYEGCIGRRRDEAEKSIISKLKTFSNFKDQKIFIEIVEYFRNFPNIILATVKQNDLILPYAKDAQEGLTKINSLS